MQHRVRIIAASPNMCDPNFKESVILLIENDQDGAFGFVINRPRDLNLGEVLLGEEPLGPDEFQAWNGGPVEEIRGFLLADTHQLRRLSIEWNESDEDQLTIRDGFFTTASPLITKTIIWQYFDTEESLTLSGQSLSEDEVASKMPFRFFLGYAGWGPKQIEQESLAGWWIDIPWNKTLILETQPSQIWRKAMELVGISSPASYMAAQSEFVQ